MKFNEVGFNEFGENMFEYPNNSTRMSDDEFMRYVDTLLGNTGNSRGPVGKQIELQEMSDFLVDRRRKNGGFQLLFRFENGYGASVIKAPYSYGGVEDLWELAVIYYSKATDSFDYTLRYDTPITDDVIGWLDDPHVVEYLREIKNLPPRK